MRSRTRASAVSTQVSRGDTTDLRVVCKASIPRPAHHQNKIPAVTNLEPGVRYRGLALQEGVVGSPQAPDYALCLLGTARAQSHFDKTTAIRSYQQLLDIWKNADPDFLPAQEAKRELAALSQTSS